MKLEQNYRSTETILAAANAVIANNRGQMAKKLWSELGQGEQIQLRALHDEHAEARYVVGEIERLVDEGASRAEIAVLYRTNAMSRVIEDTLVRREIAYQVIGGTKFYERAEIKDAIAYLSLLANPFDVGELHADRQLARGAASARPRSRGCRATRPRWTSRCGRRRLTGAGPGLGAAAVKALGRFMSSMAELRAMTGAAPLGGEVDSGDGPRSRWRTPIDQSPTRGASVGSPSCSRRCSRRAATSRRWRPSARSRRRGGSRTSSSSSRSGASSTQSVRWRGRPLERFLQEIALVADADSRSDDEGLVTLMTLHNAKGLEYPTVFITGCEDGVFPHSRAIDEGGLEEERRLFYVGVTRAMRELYLTYARRRAVFGAQSYGMRSRFLDEIPGELLDEASRGRLRPAASCAPSLARGSAETTLGRSGSRGAAWAARAGADPGLPPRRGRRARRVRRRRRHRRRARRGDRRALRRRRLRAQADGRVRAPSRSAEGA